MTGPGSTVTVEEGVNITWIDADPDSDASISLWEDSNNTGYNGSLLAWGISEDDLGNYGSHFLSTASMPDGKEFYVYATIDDGHTVVNSDNYTAKIIVDHPTWYADAFTSEVQSEEENGDGDGVIEGFESVEINIRLRNDTGDDVTGVHGTLSTPDGDIIFTDDYQDYGGITDGAWSTWGDFHANLNFRFII